MLHFCRTSHIFLTEEGVSSSTWRPPPLSLCPQGHLSTPPLTVSASSPPCSTFWIHIPSPIRPVSARSLQPDPRSSFSAATLKRMRHAHHLTERCLRRAREFSLLKFYSTHTGKTWEMKFCSCGASADARSPPLISLHKSCASGHEEVSSGSQ